MTNNDRYKKLIGQFLKGSCKNSSTFFGELIEVDDDFLILSGETENPPQRQRLVKISEIAEMVFEPLHHSLHKSKEDD